MKTARFEFFVGIAACVLSCGAPQHATTTVAQTTPSASTAQTPHVAPKWEHALPDDTALSFDVPHGSKVYFGLAGARWNDKGEFAAEWLPEQIQGAYSGPNGDIWFIGTSSRLYHAESSLGRVMATLDAQIPNVSSLTLATASDDSSDESVHSRLTTDRDFAAVAVYGQGGTSLFVSSADQPAWRNVYHSPPSSRLSRWGIAHSNHAIGLLENPQKVLVSVDRGAHFLTVPTPGFGAEDFSTDTKGTFWLKGSPLPFATPNSQQALFAQLEFDPPRFVKQSSAPTRPNPGPPPHHVRFALQGNYLFLDRGYNDSLFLGHSIADLHPAANWPTKLVTLAADGNRLVGAFQTLKGLAVQHTTDGKNWAEVAVIAAPRGNTPEQDDYRGGLHLSSNQRVDLWVGPNVQFIATGCLEQGAHCNNYEVRPGIEPALLDSDRLLQAVIDEPHDRIWLVYLKNNAETVIKAESLRLGGASKLVATDKAIAACSPQSAIATPSDAGDMGLFYPDCGVALRVQPDGTATRKYLPFSGVRLVFSGVRGLASRHQGALAQAWETADAGATWTETSLHGLDGPPTCNQTGCSFSQGFLRTGWDVEPRQTGPIQLRDTKPSIDEKVEPTDETTPELVWSNKASPTISCEPSGKMLVSGPSFAFLQYGAEVAAFVRTSQAKQQITDDNGHPETRTFSEHALVTVSDDGNVNTHKWLSHHPNRGESRAAVKWTNSGFIAIRFTFDRTRTDPRFGGDGRLSTVEIEADWLRYSTSKWSHVLLSATPPYRVSRFGSAAQVELIDDGLFIPATKTYLVKDDGHVDTLDATNFSGSLPIAVKNRRAWWSKGCSNCTTYFAAPPDNPVGWLLPGETEVHTLDHKPYLIGSNFAVPLDLPLPVDPPVEGWAHELKVCDPNDRGWDVAIDKIPVRSLEVKGLSQKKLVDNDFAQGTMRFTGTSWCVHSLRVSSTDGPQVRVSLTHPEQSFIAIPAQASKDEIARADYGDSGYSDDGYYESSGANLTELQKAKCTVSWQAN